MAKEKKNNEENTEEDISKRLDELTKSLDKKYGKGTIIKGSESLTVPRWELSSPKLSDALGGGLPKGIIMETYGLESSGKTSLSTLIAVDIQRQGGIVGIVDAENSYDMKYAESLGLDKEKVWLSQPNSGEQALDIVEKFVETQVDYIIVDSVAALVPQAEIEGDMSDQQMGAQARLVGKAMRKITPKLGDSTINFINQIREKIGVMFGNPETVPGGRAIKFYSSIRMEVRIGETLMENEEAYGIQSKIKIKKNKTGTPFKKIVVDLLFRKGIDTTKEYIDYGVYFGFIEKSGSWFVIDNEKIQGRNKVAQYFKNNPEIFNDIKNKVSQFLKGNKENNEIEQEGNTETTEQEST